MQVRDSGKGNKDGQGDVEGMETSTKQGNEADDKPEFIRVRVRGGGQG